ncbi:hypothetical protein GA0115261_116601, partial [Streptomyces sp. OspMP-M43]
SVRLRAPGPDAAQARAGPSGAGEGPARAAAHFPLCRAPHVAGPTLPSTESFRPVW